MEVFYIFNMANKYVLEYTILVVILKTAKQFAVFLV